MVSRKAPVKKENRKEKIIDTTLTSSKVSNEAKAKLKTHQKPIANFLRENDISVLLGDAGCAKDFVQMYRALEGLQSKEFEKIVICKPIVESSRSIGFLPGPQPLDSRVLTPCGWSTMGDIQVNDEIIGKDGKTYNVTGKSEVNKEPVYELKTTDGRIMECSSLHLMHTLDANDKKHRIDKIKYKKEYTGKVRTIDEIISTLHTSKGKTNHYINYCQPVTFTTITDKYIPPYLMGVLLGDGSISNSISFSNIDEELIEKCRLQCFELGLNLNRVNNSISYNISSDKENNKPAREVIIEDTATNIITVYPSIGIALKTLDIKRTTLAHRCENKVTVGNIKYSFGEKEGVFSNPIKEELHKLGLSKSKALTKFVPKSYIYNAAIDERLELLRGLFDTDGACDGTSAGFTTISKQLALDVVEIVQSLGGRSNIYTRDRRGKEAHFNTEGRNIVARHISYEVVANLDFNPFYISRKASRYNPKYKHLIGIKSIEKIREDYVQCLKTSAVDGLYITNNYIVTHNSLEDKTDIYLKSFRDNIVKIVGKENVNSIMAKVQFEHVGFQRGNTLPEHSVIILSEIQNLTASEAHTYISRVPQSSKLFINGDASQSDLGMKSGLNDFLESISGVEGIGIAILDPVKHQMRRRQIIEITENYIRIQKAKGNFFVLDTNRFEYVDL